MEQPPFELRILGPTQLRGTKPVQDDANVRPPKRLALLAYLALETADGFRRRDQIVGLFWPDLPQEAARTQLRKALFAFRESLGADAVVSRGEGEVRIDPALVWCDAVALVQYVRDERWAEAMALYRGELLDGLFPEGVAQEFEDWLSDRRKALREQAAAAAWECCRAEESHGDRKAASVMARRALELTPDDEAGVRRLMELLDRHGDRSGALRVYAEWQARLQAEFGVEPDPKTRKLARHIQAARKGESHETPPTQSVPAYRPAGTVATSPATGDGESAGGSAGGGPRSSRRSLAPVLRVSGIAAGLVVIGALITWAIGRDSGPQAPPTSVAVLPIRAIGDSALGRAAQAIAEELTNALVAAGGLTVRSTTHARDAMRATGDVDRIGRRLGVAFVVDGAVQRSASRIRVTLRLVRTNDATAAWAGTFDSDEASQAALGRDAAGAIASAVRDQVVRAP